MRCVLERFQNDLKLLVHPGKTLKSEGFFKTNKVYIEYHGLAEDQEAPFQLSKFYHLLDRHQNTIRIHVNLPSLSKYLFLFPGCHTLTANKISKTGYGNISWLCGRLMGFIRLILLFGHHSYKRIR